MESTSSIVLSCYVGLLNMLVMLYVLRRYRYSTDSDDDDDDDDDDGDDDSELETEEEEESSEEEEEEEMSEEEEEQIVDQQQQRLNPTQLQHLPKVEKKEFCKKWILGQMNVEYLISEAKEPFASPSAAINEEHMPGPSPKPNHAKEAQILMAAKRKFEEAMVKNEVKNSVVSHPTSSSKVFRVNSTNASHRQVGKIEGGVGPPLVIKVPQTSKPMIGGSGGPGPPPFYANMPPPPLPPPSSKLVLKTEQVTKDETDVVVPLKKSRLVNAKRKVAIKLPRNVAVRKTSSDVIKDAPLVLRRSPRLHVQSHQN